MLFYHKILFYKELLNYSMANTKQKFPLTSVS